MKYTVDLSEITWLKVRSEQHSLIAAKQSAC